MAVPHLLRGQLADELSPVVEIPLPARRLVPEPGGLAYLLEAGPDFVGSEWLRRSDAGSVFLSSEERTPESPFADAFGERVHVHRLTGESGLRRQPLPDLGRIPPNERVEGIEGIEV